MADPHAEQDESYFVSMTDLMVGMLFIFIILLMAFALNLKEQETELKVQERKLTEVDKARQQMLKDIETALRNKGITVTVLPESGVLRLPEQVLFDVDRSKLQPKGLNAVAKLAEALNEVLPCYAGDGQPDSCPDKAYGRLESVFVEGHTDDTGKSERNWELSYERAKSVYERLLIASPVIGDIRNDKDGQRGKGEKLVGISGYADQRPAIDCKGLTNKRSIDECRKSNRRIDLRFIMAVPNPERQAQIDGMLNRGPANP